MQIIKTKSKYSHSTFKDKNCPTDTLCNITLLNCNSFFFTCGLTNMVFINTSFRIKATRVQTRLMFSQIKHLSIYLRPNLYKHVYYLTIFLCWYMADLCPMVCWSLVTHTETCSTKQRAPFFRLYLINKSSEQLRFTQLMKSSILMSF